MYILLLKYCNIRYVFFILCGNKDYYYYYGVSSYMYKFQSRQSSITGCRLLLRTLFHSILVAYLPRGVSGPPDHILKGFLPRFWIQSKILADLKILQLQWITISSIFGTWILDYAC